ncbi:hypothetical protein P170DRAFT_439502 [Aspergillus steynii IBT 23096]|uniref:Inheritance of peroxisomes protein 1 n=1 Tax=Aspergillus steynii IBT 23096 TaxID=1392250 RepID=A0A2I2FYS8_9EURO|nr:uncharacterized protein P170DRAFT_439502 [Aspergillus steynii IBT 23096]PLB45779.1 hypothetical protein P170DRAFT_439502 [Aspergillus steynii IBT 23096]
MSDPSDAPLPQIQSIRRSATLPTKLNPRNRRTSNSFKPSENDLFFHPSAKVVHFAPRALAPIPSSTAPSDFDYPVDTVETLPWRSPTERTVAFAPLRLENVHGLTVFLKCGSVVHAILKNSQCWCVDGVSTFVLRIRPLTYYRIELPNETDEDRELIVGMKDALPQVLRYEVTPCPFKRGFTVPIPEAAKAPRRKKKAWSPKGRRDSAPIYLGLAKEHSPVREEITVDYLSAGEETDGNTTDGSGFLTRGSNSTILETIPDDNEFLEGSHPPELPVESESRAPSPAPSLAPSLAPPVPESLDIPRRSVAETQRSFQTLLARFEENPETQVEPDPALSSSVDSFHSIEHSLSPLPETESHLDSQPEIPVDESKQNDSRGCDEEKPSEDSIFQEVDYAAETKLPTIVCRDCSSPDPKEPPTASASKPEPRPSTAVDAKSSADNHDLASTTSSNPNLSSMSAEFRRRSKTSHDREVSPMPPASTLALAHPPEKYDAASIIQKTCKLVLVPPIQLFVVLIHIAARIVIGPAVNSAMGDMDGHTSSQETMDDFDLPLARDNFRKRSVSEELRRFDPWELD